MTHKNDSLFSIFSKIACETPDKVSISYDSVQISYYCLLNKALAIAHAIGMRRNPVAILCQQHQNAIASMLGCLYNRTIFIPINSDLPIARIQAIILNSGADLILADYNLDGLTQVINISALPEDVCTKEIAPVDHQANMNVAYIIFTSGTTGTPKGVAQSEVALRQHIIHYIKSINAQPNDRIAMVAGFGYDAALMDIFSALLSGATLMPLAILQHTTESLRKLIYQYEITIFHSTPSVFRLIFTKNGKKYNYKKIKAVILGGEQARQSDLKLFNDTFSVNSILINGFGPSESTLALQANFHFGDIVYEQGLSIGLPVPEMDVDLIDIKKTSNGEIGEIVLRSPNVFMGYVSRPEDISILQTQPRKEIHYTGDLGRRLPDGSLIHVGRKDSQVKIAGIRIELEEINSLLVLQPGVEDAATRVVENGHGNAWLISWILTMKDKLDESAIIAALRLQLPQTSVPSRIIPMESFPRHPNGKVDTSILPIPTIYKKTTDDLDPLSQQLANIWRDCLGLENNVSLSDRFIDIGGSSLSAISVISRVQQENRVRIRPSSLLLNPTLDQFINQVKIGVKNAE
ncbi:non-ribosomal peptide synthetase [Brenneria goodwinii]|uniref:non-ribosomal peptide synthetase n=2 Tax=Brenneria goodwinii TaxID=1109412 RepID=UPI001EFA4B1F|nr:non-ribosomal peptide synthetase [Brenneria goodwinii]MCG8157176.1 non-ribosomal peptide synthetase [Brenneria goodwinii]MCG8160084.1 non-ribosomal peptide synthetase [Brenneria goodwinii]MCG8164607.1 non-ribosomal peptide synthetase [Brenneria goodwinii]MCG8170687.1 non-ribosomal peptide synthetase [Brenneria goodwinii]MCG8174215.1 non-ribosomal peptide synthetase [Brenneria goodwinii]